MKRLVTDALQERLQPLLPPPPPRRYRFPLLGLKKDKALTLSPKNGQ